MTPLGILFLRVLWTLLQIVIRILFMLIWTFLHANVNGLNAALNNADWDSIDVFMKNGFAYSNRLLISISQSSKFRPKALDKPWMNIMALFVQLLYYYIYWTHRESSLEEVGWVRIKDRRSDHKLVMMYKSVNNLAPSVIRSSYKPL